jgi:hypothetical protein
MHALQVVQLQKVQNVSLYSSYNLKKAQITSTLQGSKCTPLRTQLAWALACQLVPRQRPRRLSNMSLHAKLWLVNHHALE